MITVSPQDHYEGYTGKALNFLKRNGASVWSRIVIHIDDTPLEGLLLPAPEGTDDLVYIKLMNGYNVAFKIDKIKNLHAIGKEKVAYKIPQKELLQPRDLPNVVIVGAGGTIASRVEYTTGAVKPAFSAYELANAVSEIFSIANIRMVELFRIFSEDMRPSYWITMAKQVAKEINNGAEGIVITHGTDTLQFSATALAFMLEKLAVPVVFTGAQRSSDRPATDAAANIINATLFAAKGKATEVLVCMHASLHDTDALIHRGVRVRKMHSSRRDAFRTIGDIPLALISQGKIDYLKNDFDKRGMYNSSETYADAVFEEKTALIYVYPYMDPIIIESLIDKKYRGIVIAGTGLGHVPDRILPTIKRAIEEDVLVAMSTQCIWGPVKLDVYERGRVLKKLGVIPADGMLPEVAYVKLGWLLGHDFDRKTTIDLFAKNLKHEIIYREPLSGFFSNI